MSDRLVTIATFENSVQAQVAKSALEAEGIRVMLGDEMTVDLFWNLSNAIGGVKVQVLEEDADRALAVLDEKLGPEEDAKVDPEELDAEAEAAVPEEGAEPPEPPAPEAPEPPPSQRDEYARRFLLAAVFSLGFAPLWFYAVYLFLNSAFGEGPISSRAKRRLFIGCMVLVFCSAATYYILFIALLAITGS